MRIIPLTNRQHRVFREFRNHVSMTRAPSIPSHPYPKERDLRLHASCSTWTVLILSLLWSATSWATDIQCDSTKQPAQRVICDHAILNHEYGDIYDQQQALIQQGKLSPSDIAAWKQKLDACTDVHCVDGVFAQWGTTDRSLANSPAAPVMSASEALGPAGGAGMAASETIAPAVGMTASDALGPAPGAASDAAAASAVAAASAQASGVPVSRQGSAYGVALPQAVSDASAPAPASAALANARGTGASVFNPLSIALIVLLVIAGAGVGGIVVYQRRRG